MLNPLSITMVLLVTACFAAALLNLAAQNRLRGTVTGAAITAAVLTGAVFYGAGYAWTLGFSFEALFRALLALCRMFAGVNDFASVQASPLLCRAGGRAFFWFGHFCAFYVTASAAISTLGEKLLRRIRATLLRRGTLTVIYGLNPDSLSYGRRTAGQRHRSVLFVDPDGNTGLETSVSSTGALLEKSASALGPDRRFLRHINMTPGSRRLDLAALHRDGRKNAAYAVRFLETLHEAGIRPDQVSVIVSGIPENAPGILLPGASYCSHLLTFDDYELTARLITKNHPPADRISFDARGRAEENFHAVILGYGKMGRAILSRLICCGQFCGSTFRADIFDPAAQNGFLHEHELLRRYDIRFHRADARSDEFYAFLEENAGKISIIAVCTGDRNANREIADDLDSWFAFGRKLPMIIQATGDGYICQDEQHRRTECENIYESGLPDVNMLDAMAMQVNHIYRTGSSKTAAQEWEECDYFSRASSRASADFYPAMLRAAHTTPEKVLAGDWPPDEETLENLAVTEHMRWCAFHYVMGFTAMPDEVYEERARQYLEEKERTGKSGVRIGRDMENHMHACLIPWEELDALSEKENRITGGSIDYKQMDRDNVLVIPKVLAAMKSASEGQI